MKQLLDFSVIPACMPAVRLEGPINPGDPSALRWVIARLDRAIQIKELDSPVKPENDSH